MLMGISVRRLSLQSTIPSVQIHSAGQMGGAIQSRGCRTSSPDEENQKTHRNITTYHRYMVTQIHSVGQMGGAIQSRGCRTSSPDEGDQKTHRNVSTYHSEHK